MIRVLVIAQTFNKFINHDNILHLVLIILHLDNV